jgi:hypothetical protein
MKRLLGIAFALAIAVMFSACGNHPSQNDAAAFGTVRVWYGDDPDAGQTDWSSQQIEQLDLQLTAEAALGPTFVRVQTEGESDVSVRHWDSLSMTCANGVETYTFATHVIRIDPVCTQGFLEFRAAFGHGLGHHVGLGHVCRSADQLPGAQCSSVGTGVAIMNPRIRYGDPDITFDTYEGEVPPVDPTPLDLAEFRRVHP